MSDGKNALKLPGDHIDFNLNLKIILPPLFDSQKNNIHTTHKKKQTNKKQKNVLHFRPTQNTGEQENRNYELRVSFCNSATC